MLLFEGESLEVQSGNLLQAKVQVLQQTELIEDELEAIARAGHPTSNSLSASALTPGRRRDSGRRSCEQLDYREITIIYFYHS